MANLINKDFVTSKPTIVWKYDNSIAPSSNVMANYVQFRTLPAASLVHVTTSSGIMTGYTIIPVYNLSDGGMIKGQVDINSLQAHGGRTTKPGGKPATPSKKLWIWGLIGIVAIVFLVKSEKQFKI